MPAMPFSHSEDSYALQILPQEAELEEAVARDSMPAVFTILAIWQTAPSMLNEDGCISPALTTSALLAAIYKGRTDIVSILLAASCDDGLPIMEAIKAGFTGNFEAFLWNRWEINKAVEQDGPPALGYAVHNKDLVVWLLKNGADPNAGYQYDTALSRAVLHGSFDIIEMLLSHNGDVQRGDVLHWAVEREEEACEVVALLLERGALPNQLRFDGLEPEWSVYGIKGLGSPLHRAVALNRLDVIRVLLQHGADKNVKNTLGKTADEVAQDLGNTAALKLLSIESG